MLNEAYASIFVALRQIYVPGGAIAITVLAFNLIGDSLRDVLGVENVSKREAAAVSATVSSHNAGTDTSTSTEPVLSIEALSVAVCGREGAGPLVEDVSFEVPAGETVGLVGERLREDHHVAGCHATVASQRPHHRRCRSPCGGQPARVLPA